MTSYYETTESTQASCHYPTSMSIPIVLEEPPQSMSRLLNCGLTRLQRSELSRNVKRPPSPLPLSQSRRQPTPSHRRTSPLYPRRRRPRLPSTRSQGLCTYRCQSDRAGMLKSRELTRDSQPEPTTVCRGGGEAAVITVNPNQSAVTQTNLVYETSYLSGTVWVG